MGGVTLLELMAVVSIVAILSTIGVASYRGITTSSRIAGEINGLLGDMQYARSEALRTGQNVIICTSSSGTDCAGATTFGWNQGWIVFADPTGGKTTGGNAALVLRKQTTFTGTDTFSDGVTSSVTFDREGLALGLLTTNGALLPLHESTNNIQKTRCLQITNVGNVAVQSNATLGTCT